MLEKTEKLIVLISIVLISLLTMSAVSAANTDDAISTPHDTDKYPVQLIKMLK